MAASLLSSRSSVSASKTRVKGNAHRGGVQMKIAIAGLGVAGSYLLNRLSEEHDVVGFERQPFDKFDAVCAWGTSRHELGRILKPTGLDFEKYILHEGKTMYVDLGSSMLKIPLTGLVTYDKHQLELDLVKGKRARYGVRATKEQLTRDGYDLMIDATGFHRELLPKLKRDEYVPCIEYRMKYNPTTPVDDFYIRPFGHDSGYLWYFPLEKGSSFVGAGDYYKKHMEYTAKYNEDHPGQLVKRTGRPIRFLPPKLCEPFYADNVVGVGESIGTVFPILGEGIIPSLQCSEILLDTLPDLVEYRRRVLKAYSIFYDIYRLVKLKIEGKFSLTRHSYLLMKTYRYMKAREERFGLTVRAPDMYKILSV
jgi:flavin-dependent dehydrogenase